MKPDPETHSTTSRYHRSIFNDTYCQKILRGLQEAGWTYTEEVASEIRSDFEAIGQSQLIEDSFRSLRTQEKLKSGWKRSMQDKRKFHDLVTSPLIYRHHSYNKPEFRDEPIPKGVSQVNMDTMFQNNLTGLPKWYTEIVGRSSSVPWHSPAPLFEINSYIDLFMCQRYHDNGLWERARLTWFCGIFNDLPVIISHEDELGEDRWYIPLGYYNDRAALAWPLKADFPLNRY